MSWPAPYPPARRSRSRSPSRAPYPSRSSYDGYPSEVPHRADYDPYSFDRERAGYDYGRRGRSRSPPPDDLNRKRRRSLSPYERDRYDPRPRYNDDYDAHSRGYDNTRRGQASFAPTRRAPPDPHTFDYPASLKQFADWFRYFHPSQATEEDNADKAAEQEAGDGSKPRNGIKAKWEKYKKEFSSSQLHVMFEHHRKSPWFGEKYEPSAEMQRLRARVRKEGWRGYARAFVLDLESGKYDPELNEPVVEEVPPVKEETTNGSTVTTAATDSEDQVKEEDNNMQFTMDVDDDGNAADTNSKNFNDPKRNANRGEELSVMPEGNQVMIRTIPPDIGRVKLEEAVSTVPGFIHLALGDPLQKRNYYRAGWMKFADDADMASVMSELSDKKIEGFKLHVTHNVRPFVNRIRFAPEVASRPERMEKDLANAKVLASILEEEAAELRVLKIKKPEASTAVVVDDGASTDAAAPAPVDDDAPMADVPPAHAPPPQAQEEEEEEPEPEPIEKGSVAVDRRVEKVVAEWCEQNPEANEKSIEDKKIVVALDLYLDYLRNAFHTCYYCCLVTDHVEELQRKCLKHERKPLVEAVPDEIKATKAAGVEKIEKEEEKEMDVDVAKTEDLATNDTSSEKPKEKPKVEVVRDWKRNDERWLEWLDQKIALLINRSGLDPRDYCGKNYDDELTKAVEPYIKQEDEGKFRCKTCQKLFKATSFVEKHIANKHGDLVKQLDDIPYFNNFALDPHRIQPFAHPPPIVGNSQAPPPQAFGIQVSVNDYGRGGSDFGRLGGVYPPYAGNGHWDGPGPGYGSGYPQQRNDSGRRLSERITGFANDHNFGAGLPPKPTPAALDSALSAGNSQNNNSNARRGNGRSNGPPPPPPADAKEDPRAAAGKRVSYHDMDEVAEGDIELTY